ncbi:hypothetical protein ACTVJH_00120 [Desulfoplanes sp. PS50]
MSMMKRLVVIVSLLLLVSGTGMCADMQTYVDQAQKILSAKNVRSMMDVAKKLKEYGASFQPAMLLPPDLPDRVETGKNIHLLIGAYQFDALYAASFGRRNQAAKAIKAMGDLLNRTNMKSIVNTSALFPPELNWMLREPDTVDIDEVIDAYAANAPKYKDIMAEKTGFALVLDSLYGAVVEGLYIATSSALLMGDHPSTNNLLAEFRSNITLLLSLYGVFEDDAAYAANVDSSFLERSQRIGWLTSMASFLEKNQGNLSMNQIRNVNRFVSKERYWFRL